MLTAHNTFSFYYLKAKTLFPLMSVTIETYLLSGYMFEADFFQDRHCWKVLSLSKFSIANGGVILGGITGGSNDTSRRR